jgi:hypothetical protein
MTVVEKVIAGVEAGFATVPANPFAVTTDTDVTVPDPEPEPLLAVIILPAISTVISAFV